MFASNLAKKRGRTVARLTEHAKSRLRRYEWPGNVRELQNVIERAFITSADGRTLNLDRALSDVEPPEPVRPSLAAASDDRVLTAKELKELERKNIERALVAAKGRVSGPGGAASLLGLNANTLASRMKSLGIGSQ
jgi:DNA-binding NtrC family response regulator